MVAIFSVSQDESRLASNIQPLALFVANQGCLLAQAEWRKLIRKF